MNNPCLSTFDHKTLNQVDTKLDCSISIEIGLFGLGYCIFYNQQVIAVEYFDVPLSKLETDIKKNEWLRKEYASSHICSTSSKTTLIPTALYSEKNKGKYLSFNHKKASQLEILTDRIEEIDSICVYGISKAEQDIISTFFPKSPLSHFSTKYIAYLLNENKNFQGQKILLNITYNQLYVTVIENSSLLFFNIFQYSNEHDCTYYILFICEQLNLNPETIQLELTGDISKNSNTYNLIYTYIRNVGFRKRKQAISPVLVDLENHTHFPLIHQHL